MTTGIRGWGDALMTSLAAAMAMFLAAIPRIIGFLVIIIVGWFIATLIAKAVAALLRTVRFNDLAQRSGFAGFVSDMGVKTDASGFLALLAKWFVRLIVLVAAFDALGLPAVSDVMRRLLLWLPNLVVGLVVLVIGGLAAGALAKLVRVRSESRVFQSRAACHGRACGGLGVRDRGCGEPDRHCSRSREYASGGHIWRSSSRARPGLRPRRTRDGWANRGQLV